MPQAPPKNYGPLNYGGPATPRIRPHRHRFDTRFILEFGGTVAGLIFLAVIMNLTINYDRRNTSQPASLIIPRGAEINEPNYARSAQALIEQHSKELEARLEAQKFNDPTTPARPRSPASHQPNPDAVKVAEQVLASLKSHGLLHDYTLANQTITATAGPNFDKAPDDHKRTTLNALANWGQAQSPIQSITILDRPNGQPLATYNPATAQPSMR